MRANRTVQMIEDDFGGSPSPMSKTIGFPSASSAGGKHAEERILKRAVSDARKEVSDLRDANRSVR